MAKFPKKLQSKLDEREANGSLRSLPQARHLVDFSSNDYLGLARSEAIFERAENLLSKKGLWLNGATGSRLLSGNHPLFLDLEGQLASFHGMETALVFNSGYDANTGFFAAVPQRGDFVFYDELVHASIRDGITMGHAKGYKFVHNDLANLETKISKTVGTHLKSTDSEIYVVTESVFSMDGDCPDLKVFADFCHNNGYRLVVDEAHAMGVYGMQGESMLATLGLQQQVFAGIVTFGKALGCHGAAILGSAILKKYLVNFARSFIYTTAMPPHTAASVIEAHNLLMEAPGKSAMKGLRENIEFFRNQQQALGLKGNFIESDSAIHCCTIPGNENVKRVSEKLQEAGFDVRPILSPTVPQASERLRFCLHTYNTQEEISRVLELLAKFI
ncbi:aminotransferase class I/II-fold pyridoxal phosphate-dependent enzyme [Spongiimicrobium sp. 2-473A-2-J]|uniref:aminotransferase class I/II-fold pyridoxal phosphate-dependent enzyme n=1 Tax=Eudoraea algarum TaxID=3417568 RepID=UPI003D359C56